MERTVLLVIAMAAAVSAMATIPASFDWRKYGVVAPVGNQGMMGSAKVFSVVGSVESLHAINTGKLELLSTYELQDCCDSLFNLFVCIKKLRGLCSSSDYPAGGVCHSSSCSPAVTINGYRRVLRANETDLQYAVLRNPVVVLVNAGLGSFQLYTGGVYSDPNCTEKELDHALLVVGYGTLDGQNYWICQNSWGVAWGMEGYILIARNKGNMCGIATAGSYPV